MFERQFERLVGFQKKYPLLIILVFLTITAFMGYYAVRLETDASFDVLYLDDSDTIRLKDILRNEFGSTESLEILVRIDQDVNAADRVQDIRHPAVLNAIKTLTESLETETTVETTASIVDLLEHFYGRLPSTLEESKEMIDSLPEDVKEGVLKSTLSDDRSHALILVFVNIEKESGSLEKVETLVREKMVQTPFPIGVDADVTGMTVLINRIMWFLIKDNVRTIILALLAVFIILWAYFRSYKIAFFSIIPVIMTLIWLGGTLYLLDIKITVIIASVGAMMVGMSVDYGIHLTHSYHRKIKDGDNKAIEHTLTHIGGALVAAVTTTIAGFTAMLLGAYPVALTQGKVLAIGIFYAFFITCVMLPPLMILQRKYIYSRLDEVVFRIVGRRKTEKNHTIDVFLSKMAAFQVKAPWIVLMIVLIMTIVAIGGLKLVYMDNENQNWLPEGDVTVNNRWTVSYNFGGIIIQNVLFMLDKEESSDPDSVKDMRDPRVTMQMKSLDKVLGEIRWIDSIDSPTTEMKSFNDGKVPNDFDSIKKLTEKVPSIKAKYNEDYSVALYRVKSGLMSREEYLELVNEIESVPFPREISIKPQGGEADLVELDQMLLGDTTRTALIGFTFIIIIAAIFYNSMLAGLLAFFPIIIALLWTVGIMGYIDLPFTILTTGMLSMLMGIGIDFSIHLIHSIKHSLKQLKPIQEAISEALLNTGKAISIATLTTIMGFMALSFAALFNTKRLGWTLAIGIFCTFFACTLIVPAIMVIQHKIKHRKNYKKEVIGGK